MTSTAHSRRGFPAACTSTIFRKSAASAKQVLPALALAALFGLSMFHPPSAQADEYPSAPVRLIVPWPPGGATDILGRLIANKLAASLGQAFIVDNKPGAGTTIGLDVVAKAKPDGYTLVLASPDLTIAPNLFPKLPFDPVKDFAPVALIVDYPLVLFVPPSFPPSSLSELLAYTKAHPGEVFYASSGNGSAGHLAMEQLKTKMGMGIVHVPYKGSAPAIFAVLAGQAQVILTGLAATMPHLQAGKLKPLAYGGKKLANSAVNVRTFDEQGVPGVLATNWVGVVAPNGTSSAIVDKLNAELKKAMAAREVHDSLAKFEADFTVTSPEELAMRIKDEVRTWAEIVRASGAKID